MKTIKALKKEIDDITNQLQYGAPVTKAQQTRNLNRMAFLREVILYLETSPSEEFLLKTKEELEAKLSRRHFEPPQNAYKLTRPQLSKMRQEWDKLHGCTALREHLRTVDFILN